MESIVKDEVCDFDNLYKALQHCKHNVMWKDSVAGYVKNGLVNIHKLKESVEDGTYELDEYTAFKVYEPKERDIVSTRIKDRVFQRSLCDNYFYPKMTKSFIYDNCACQVDKGNEFARKRLIAHLQRYYRKYGTDGWVLKTDLKNFFGSTSHELAMNSVRKRIDDEWVGQEVERIVDSFTQGNDPNVGLGLGSETTQLIELSVLDDLDHIIKEQFHIRHYERYNDDTILISNSREELEKVLEFMRKWTSERGLLMSPKKTQIFPLSQGIRFLGYRFRLSDTGKVIMTLLPEKISHERRRLKKLVDKAKAGLKTKAEVDDCYRAWKSYVGNESKQKKTHPGKRAHRDCHNLILCMDKYYKNLWR